MPDDIQVNAEVRVNENISHAGDVRPRDTRGQRFTLLDQVANGLADDLEVPDNRVDGLLIRFELFDGQAFDVPLDSRDGLENVLDPQAPLPRRQPPPRRESCRGAAA